MVRDPVHVENGETTCIKRCKSHPHKLSFGIVFNHLHQAKKKSFMIVTTCFQSILERVVLNFPCCCFDVIAMSAHLVPTGKLMINTDGNQTSNRWNRV